MPSIPPYKIVSGLNRTEDWAIELTLKLNEALVNKLISQFFGQTLFNEDLAADVWLALLNRKEPFQNLNDLTRFLNSTTIKICQSARRKNETRENHEERLIYHLRSMGEQDLEIAEAKAHQQMLIRQTIACIPGKGGQVFHMFYIEKLSEVQIAERLNMAEKTVTNHLSAGYKFLKMNRQETRRRYAYQSIVYILYYLYETL